MLQRKEPTMKTALHFVYLAAFLTFVGCTAPSYTGKYPPCYEYTAQVLAMPTCEVTMELVSPCERYFRTEYGREFYIGSPGADEEVARFLGTLEEGKSYWMPDAFMKYREAQRKKLKQDKD
jgi:hypothetical protein